VASFFLTRIDVLVDKLLESKADAHARDLCGKIAVANAKLAYQSMKRILAAQHWEPCARTVYAPSASYGQAPARRTRISTI
jgi:hypothetical protein